MLKKNSRVLRWVVVLAVLSLSVAGMVTVIGGTAHGAMSDPEAIQQVIREALQDEQTVDITPAAFHSNVRVPDDVMQKVVDDIRYEAQQHYAGQRLDQITRILSVHAREQAEPGTEREVAGGIENLNFAKVEVKGDSATVSLSVRKWLDYLHFDVEGRPHLVKPPHLLLNYTFGLTRSDAGWRIVAEDFKFASGAV